ncbi:MAG TPA: hypothetical protein VHC90_03745 [Bryobacteraceae bacterium]|nr:hypothetical protein [Bryobacteraceae bacterium]
MSLSLLAASLHAAPTFYKDVLPILQDHCQSCHRAGEIGPMPLMTYEDARKWRSEIARRTAAREMPPWFADPRIGHFANDPSLTPAQIATIGDWSGSGAPAGNPADAPPPRKWAAGFVIPQPDLVVTMPQPVPIPAHGDIEYTYEIVHTNFTEDRWVRMSEIRPSSRAHVHHAVVYIRPPGAKWLADKPIGRAFTAASMAEAETTSDILLVYAPGSSPDEWPQGMAKLIPRGSDLIFQMHYTANGHAATDRTSIGMIFAKQPPTKRVLTLQLTNSHFTIPPGDPSYRVEARGTIPNDALLLSFFPHLHLRGKEFEYNIVHSPTDIEPLLRVNYNFYWQLSYRLAQPRLLKAGTTLQAVAIFDNSRNNPHNPDPTAEVTWGDQTWQEMMVGFFDVAVDPSVDKDHFFQR